MTTKIINKQFASECFQYALKIASVLPLFKKGVKDDPNNSRPISLLPILTKMFEKLMVKQMVKHNFFLKLMSYLHIYIFSA